MPRYEDFRATNGTFEKVLFSGRTASGAGLSPDIWDDCPIANMQVDPTLGIYVFDDFAVAPVLTGWPYKITGTNGTFTALAGQMYGVARAATAGADNDECEVACNNNVAGIIKADATHNWWFEARIAIKQITVAQGIFVGLAEEAAVADDFLATNTMDLADVDLIGFHYIAATDIAPVVRTVIQLNGGGTYAVVQTGILTAAAGTYVKLGMKTVSGRTYFYVNGAPLTSSALNTATNYPLNQVMNRTLAVKSGDVAATTNYVDIDWWAAAQLR